MIFVYRFRFERSNATAERTERFGQVAKVAVRCDEAAAELGNHYVEQGQYRDTHTEHVALHGRYDRLREGDEHLQELPAIQNI